MTKVCPICKKEFEPKHAKRKYCDECKEKYGQACFYYGNKERARKNKQRWLQSENGLAFRARLAKKQAQRWATMSEADKEHVRAVHRAWRRKRKREELYDSEERETR